MEWNSKLAKVTVIDARVSDDVICFILHISQLCGSCTVMDVTHKLGHAQKI